MLLQFTVENFQCIKQRTTLDMIAVQGKNGITEHKKSLIKDKYLPIAAIYGPNGGGKSTILKAFEKMRLLIVYYLYNDDNTLNKNSSFRVPKILPFAFDDNYKNKPTSFEVLIELSNIQYKYCVSVYKGLIVDESLWGKNEKEEPAPIFKRNIKQDYDLEDIISVFKQERILDKYWNIELSDSIKNFASEEMASKVTGEVPLLAFLRRFYLISPLKEICEWFKNCLYLDYSTPYQEKNALASFSVLDKSKNSKEVKRLILQMLSNMDIKIKDFTIKKRQQERTDTNDIDIDTVHEINNNSFPLPLELESNGTRKVFGLVPFLILALNLGCTLFFDELDAKLHPKLLEYIISIFTKKETNPNGSQLIFTSHEMTTMNNSVFRRDEIFFMAMTEMQDSELFPLTAIRTEDGEMVRKDAVYSKQYLEGRYGADPYFQKMQKWD